MSWLSQAWGKVRSPVGNALKNISPLLAFTPLGPLGAGIAGGLGEAMRRGPNVGNVLKAGVSNAAIGAGAKGVAGLARSAFAPGSSGAGTVAAGSAGGEASSVMSPAAGSYGQAATAAAPALPAGGGGGGGSSMASLLSRLGGAAKENPLVVGQIASGVLGAREQGNQTGLQRERFDFERQQYGDEQKRREEMARLLGPLFQQMMQSRTAMTPSPYR